MKSTVRHFMLLFVVYGSICAAEPSSTQKKDEAEDSIAMRKTSKNGITSIIFRKGDTNFYRILFKDVIYERVFFYGHVLGPEFRVQEYDLDFDGKPDAIQIGADDQNFTPFIVLIEEGRIDIEALPDNWKDGSEYPHKTFMNYVKKRKGIK